MTINIDGISNKINTDGTGITISIDDDEKFRLGSNGEIGFSGTNFGLNNQVATSQGPGKKVRWRDATGLVKIPTKPEAEAGVINNKFMTPLRTNDLILVHTSVINAALQDILDNLIPAGSIIYFANDSPPTGWLQNDGSAKSRTTYSKLFAAIGTRYGAGNGSTTFNIPDDRGEFIRVWDSGRGADGGRSLGSYQGDAIRNIVGAVQTEHSLGLFRSDGYSGAFSPEGIWRGSAAGGTGSLYNSGVGLDASKVVPTADENRPRNITYMACIKY